MQIINFAMTDLFIGIINIEDKEFNFLKDIIYEKTGIALAPHKKIMLQSRLNIRLRQNQMSNFADYVQKLKTDKSFYNSEIPEIINRITTNKTDFFRENHHFEYLKKTYLPSFEEKNKLSSRKKLRVWCSACSTGEEPYSIAITILEYLQNKASWDVKIYASDIDTNVLETAKKGIYKEDRVAIIPNPLKEKYFTSNKKGAETEYTVKPILKSIIEFKKINLLEDPYPINESMDLIFCRNVIIYFDKNTQKKIFTAFEKLLLDQGILIIGHSETLFGISEAFKFLGQTVYQKK